MLWLQLVAAGVAMMWAWSVMFEGATGVDFYSGCMKELKHAQQRPGFQEPAKIRDLSQSDMIERLQSSALESAHQGGLCFFLSLGLVVFSGVELWLLRGARPRAELKPDEIERG
jgi:hypothetical protein